MLIKAVEKRLDHVNGIPEDHALEFLSDKGGVYITAETRRTPKQLSLWPITTPVCSPQTNGMAERFVNTFRRDYIGCMDLADAKRIMAQMASASSTSMKSIRTQR